LPLDAPIPLLNEKVGVVVFVVLTTPTPLVFDLFLWLVLPSSPS